MECERRRGQRCRHTKRRHKLPACVGVNVAGQWSRLSRAQWAARYLLVLATARLRCVRRSAASAVHTSSTTSGTAAAGEADVQRPDLTHFRRQRPALSAPHCLLYVYCFAFHAHVCTIACSALYQPSTSSICAYYTTRSMTHIHTSTRNIPSTLARCSIPSHTPLTMSTAILTPLVSSMTLPYSARACFSFPAVIEDYRIDEHCQPYTKPGAAGLSAHNTHRQMAARRRYSLIACITSFVWCVQGICPCTSACPTQPARLQSI